MILKQGSSPLTTFRKPGASSPLPLAQRTLQAMAQQTCSTKCSLQETINLGDFYSVDDESIIVQIGQSFPDELERLKNAEAVESTSQRSRVSNGAHARPSPSQILYGTDYDEVNRTLIGVLALRWIQNDQYGTFVGGQPEGRKLTQESFNWLRKLFSAGLRTKEDLFALVMSMIINDLGKDPELETDYYLQMQSENKTLHGQNHDIVLLEAARAGMIPCLSRLDEQLREDVMLGLELGSELNAGQLAQAENVPVNLEGLLHMRNHEHAFELKFMEQILDMAGSGGHTDYTCAKTLNEPVFQGFKTVHEVSRDVIEGNSDLRRAYDRILVKRSDLLQNAGFRRLSVSKPGERALLRLLTMGRTADEKQADLFNQAFEALDDCDKQQLVTGLNIDGTDNETAVLPYYMPAMLSETLENMKEEPAEHQVRALSSLMRYLAKVLDHQNEGRIDTVPEDGEVVNTQIAPGIVIERNMLMARATLSSDAFKINPDILNTLDIPPGQVLQRRRTSHSL